MSSPKSEGFSVRLRQIREERDLSQTDLAKRTGLQPSAISHFESGRRDPSFENLKKLSDALEVTTDFLLGRESKPSAAAGPLAGKIFRHLTDLKQEDIEQLEQYAAFLAQKKTKREDASPGHGRKD